MSVDKRILTKTKAVLPNIFASFPTTRTECSSRSAAYVTSIVHPSCKRLNRPSSAIHREPAQHRHSLCCKPQIGLTGAELEIRLHLHEVPFFLFCTRNKKARYYSAPLPRFSRTVDVYYNVWNVQQTVNTNRRNAQEFGERLLAGALTCGIKRVTV